MACAAGAATRRTRYVGGFVQLYARKLMISGCMASCNRSIGVTVAVFPRWVVRSTVRGTWARCTLRFISSAERMFRHKDTHERIADVATSCIAAGGNLLRAPARRGFGCRLPALRRDATEGLPLAEPTGARCNRAVDSGRTLAGLQALPLAHSLHLSNANLHRKSIGRCVPLVQLPAHALVNNIYLLAYGEGRRFEAKGKGTSQGEGR